MSRHYIYLVPAKHVVLDDHYAAASLHHLDHLGYHSINSEALKQDIKQIYGKQKVEQMKKKENKLTK